MAWFLDIDWAEAIKRNWGDVPKQLKLALAVSVLVGVVAHFFMYADPAFTHDDASLYSSIEMSLDTLAKNAGASRWFNSVPYWVVGNVKLPWLFGLASLALYGLSAWLVCVSLRIERLFSVGLLAALIVTSPTVIDSHVFVGGTLNHAIAFLLSVLSFVCFRRGGAGGFAGAFVFLFLSEGIYAAFMDVTASLFFIESLLAMALSDRRSRELLREHIRMLLLLLGSVAGTYALMLAARAGGAATFQERVTAVEARGMGQWLLRIVETYGRLLYCFLPGGLSFFWGNKLLFVLFWSVAIVGLAQMVGAWRRHRQAGDVLGTSLFAADLLLLPFAMNAIGMLYTSHDLMRMAFLSPWILWLALAERLDPARCAEEGEGRRRVGYRNLVLALSVTTILNGIYLANLAYMKLYNNYLSAMQLVARISDRVEGAAGYEPGVTPVYFVGDLDEHYAPVREQFAFVDSLTALTSRSVPNYDTAITYGDVLRTYLLQQAGLDMVFAAKPSWNEENPGRRLKKAGYDVEEAAFDRMLEETEAFPARDCTFWCGDVLVVKLSAYHEPLPQERSDLAHRIRNLLDPYEE